MLVRKIDKGLWLQNNILEDESVSADAITNCMKTRHNTLSVWEVNDNALTDAVLAIVAGHDHLDSIDVICFDRARLIEKGILIKPTPGLTPVVDMQSSHQDIHDLTYPSLGLIADETILMFKNNNVIRFTMGDLKKILREAIVKGRVNKVDLSPDVSKKL